MPAFKHKTTKQILSDDRNITTLDSVHKEKQAEFNYIKTVVIPELKNEKQLLKAQLKFGVGNVNGYGDDSAQMSLETRLEKQDRIAEITATIREHTANIKTYYLNNNKYIFSYFETKKEISNSGPQYSSSQTTTADPYHLHLNPHSKHTIPDSSRNSSATMSKTQIINSFFKIPNNSVLPSCVPGDALPNRSSDTAASNDIIPNNDDCQSSFQPRPPQQQQQQQQQQHVVASKHDLYKLNCTNVQQYLHNVDNSFIDLDRFTYRTDICAQCHQGEMVPIDSEGILVCNKCSNFIVYFTENEKPSYKEPPKEACFYAYKRINHFREIIAQFQAKETTQIDASIISAIEHQIRKERITLDQFTDIKAKEILKKLGYNKYYEHIPFIKDKLGIKPPVMSPELEETLCSLFMEIQGPYARFCPDERVNFLNYYYTIYKLCELLGQTQFLSYFPMLKDRDKRIEQDEIWKNICKELKWIFIPTQ